MSLRTTTNTQRKTLLKVHLMSLALCYFFNKMLAQITLIIVTMEAGVSGHGAN